MQFVIEYEDGDVYTSSDCSWNGLPRKNIDSLGVFDINDNFYELKGYDIYFFSDEAMMFPGKKSKWLARMIGAFNFSGEGKFIRSACDGNVEQKDVEYDAFKDEYSKESFIINRED